MIDSVLMTVPDRLDECRRTLESVRNAGFDPTVIIDVDGAGPYPMFRRALLAALSNASHVAVFQDDIRLSTGCRDYVLQSMEEVGVLGVFSLFTSGRNHTEAVTSRFVWRMGWHAVRMPTRADGAQAYVFPVEFARLFLEVAPHPERRAQVDHWVGVFCRDHSIPYFVHVPSLCLHALPHHSTLADAGTRECRQCRSWVVSVDPWFEEAVDDG